MRPPRPRDPDQLAFARDLRRDATHAERLLWCAIRGDALGVRFRRQHPVGRYVADFACVEARLIIELDGGQHGAGRDEARDAVITTSGWCIRRYWNNEVVANLDGVLSDLRRLLSERMVKGSPPP